MRSLRLIGMIVIAASIGLLFLNSAATTNAGDWAANARQDIIAAHDIIRDNHPGSVDPLNPDFKVWLDKGEAKALGMGSSAKTESDYWRALSFYINGFSDGHLVAFRNHVVSHVWPGFLTSTDASGTTLITTSSVPSAPSGAVVTQCDGVPVERLLDERVHPFYTNAGIPHERLLMSSYLFIGEAEDQLNLLKECVIRVGTGEPRRVALRWIPIDPPSLKSALADAQGSVVPALGVHQVDGIWFVSLPSFNWWGDRAPKMKAMIEQVKAQAASLHAAPRLVIDVRGNTGGNSQWAQEIASALWSEAAVENVVGSFDQTVDWRASAQNARLTRETASRSMAAGLTQDARDRNHVADQMDVARLAGQNYFTDKDPPASHGLPDGYASPFKGKVFFLTDMHCASACLDFADIVTRMPGVTHVGLPTSADTVYIDNVEVPLPSGAARLSYSLKVYRHRVRGSNEWYVPKAVWPGGRMTDEAVARWVAML